MDFLLYPHNKRACRIVNRHALFENKLAKTGCLLTRTLVKILAIIAIIRGNGLIRLFIDGVRLRGTLPAWSGTGHHPHLAGDSRLYCSRLNCALRHTRIPGGPNIEPSIGVRIGLLTKPSTKAGVVSSSKQLSSPLTRTHDEPSFGRFQIFGPLWFRSQPGW